MNPPAIPDELPEMLMEHARAGDSVALGRLLESYRNYLRILARTQIDSGLRLRLEPSDLVQETLLEATRDFKRFAGTTERELMIWLRRILIRNLADQAKSSKRQRRDRHRQESLEALLDRSGSEVADALSRGITCPSAQASRREQAVLLADALAKLPGDYREVVILRNLEHRKFEEIARRMERSSGAVRMLWARALEKLSQLMENDS
jgi:RNA polymerase sigma-70 factor (ECF subfamily)